MNKLKLFLFIFCTLLFAKVAFVTASSFQSLGNFTISDVNFSGGTADLLILGGSEAEYFTYDDGVFSVTNPSSTNLFKIGSLDPNTKAIRVLNSGSQLIKCVKNNNLGVDHVSLPVDSGTYFIEPAGINLSNSLTYNSQCGANSCISGYVVNGSGSSAVCVKAPSSGGGGGGGGGGSFSQTCSSLVYGEWGDCINGFQFRDIISKSPDFCTLTSTHQLNAQRVCQEEYLVEENKNDVQELNKAETYHSSVDVDLVMKTERDLSKDINPQLINRLSGKILLQVEEGGQAWYLSPLKNKRYFLGRPVDAFNIMRGQGVGITNDDLNKIPLSLDFLSGKDSDGDGLPDDFEIAIGTDPFISDTDGDGFDDYTELLNGYNPLGSGMIENNYDFSNNHLGKIFLQVEKNGEAWYVSPDNSRRYFLGRPDDAFSIMRGLALGINNENIRKISVAD